MSLVLFIPASCVYSEHASYFSRLNLFLSLMSLSLFGACASKGIQFTKVYILSSESLLYK